MRSHQTFVFVALSAFALLLPACSKTEPAKDETTADNAPMAARAEGPAIADKRSNDERRSNCDLELSEQKRVFQAFVRLDDINRGQANHDYTVKEIARRESLSKECVESIAKKGVNLYPEWISEPEGNVLH